METVEIPSDQDVIDALTECGGKATAVRLCEYLVSKKHPKKDSQLAIQRATERGKIRIMPDWSLEISREVEAA